MKKKPNIQLVGYVGVDSGQVIICDPCYIDSEWKEEHFIPKRIYQHKITKDRLIWPDHFSNYEQPLAAYGNQTMNQLNETGDWEPVSEEDTPAQNPFSYNACCQLTLSRPGFGQLNYTKGHPGVGIASRTNFGDGTYPVYAELDEDGNVERLTIEFV